VASWAHKMHRTLLGALVGYTSAGVSHSADSDVSRSGNFSQPHCLQKHHSIMISRVAWGSRQPIYISQQRLS
jgi:hypothetical protein